MSRASAVVSPDEKYAVLVYGEDNGSSSKIVLLDAKKLGIQGICYKRNMYGQ